MVCVQVTTSQVPSTKESTCNYQCVRTSKHLFTCRGSSLALNVNGNSALPVNKWAW